MLDTRPADLVIDLAEVRFRGVRRSVVRAAMRARPRTAESATPWPAWVPTSTGRTQAWSGQRLRRHPDTAAAVTATRHTQVRSHADQP